MVWLVTGGAGYIGAHVVLEFLAAGEQVVVLDDLSSGVVERVPDGVPLVVGNVLDTPLVDRAVTEYGVDGIVHLAAKKRVDESIRHPMRYYRENVDGMRSLLSVSLERGIRRWVYSSSSAVYGAPRTELVREDDPLMPISPYGQTKLVGEWLLSAAAENSDMDFVALRYFNVVGAGRPHLGDPGSFTLVPKTLARLESGLPPVIYGTDYPTQDGTCIRDYVHVADVASAHVAAAREVMGPRRTRLVANVGLGRGVSTLEVVAAVLAVSGRRDRQPVTEPRRPGDAARVVGDTTRIRSALSWAPRHDLNDMVTSAWEARIPIAQRVGLSHGAER